MSDILERIDNEIKRMVQERDTLLALHYKAAGALDALESIKAAIAEGNKPSLTADDIAKMATGDENATGEIVRNPNGTAQKDPEDIEERLEREYEEAVKDV